MKRLQPIGALLALLLLTGCAVEPAPTETLQQPAVTAPAETPEPVEEPPAEPDEEPEIMEPEIVEPEPEPLEPGFHEEGGRPLLCPGGRNAADRRQSGLSGL